MLPHACAHAVFPLRYQDCEHVGLRQPPSWRHTPTQHGLPPQPHNGSREVLLTTSVFYESVDAIWGRATVVRGQASGQATAEGPHNGNRVRCGRCHTTA
jgi:hypothetical protein